ncbi:MAG: tRNA lysidine(34) synthetase TilS [Clostridia bacterium]|nr:tRNA lysidine(34) synthetase TilS [Clostridia bacterium]
MELYNKSVEYMASSGISSLIKQSSAVLVAFSGGADSAVLLRIMKEYLKDTGITVAAAHLNHMIRGEEARRDQDFCKKAADGLNIPFYTKNADVPAYANKTGMSIEEAARHIRYEFLSDISHTLGDNTLIATAHNATDNLETVIFNLARGSGTSGMAGIAPIRDQRIIRPILFATSEEIRVYAEKNQIPYVVDSTNTDTAYTRNFVRSNIVPRLKEINSLAELSVLRLSSIARSEADYINIQASHLIEGKHIKRNDFESAHPALRNAALRLLYKNRTGTLNCLSMKNLETASNFAVNGRGEISLPKATLVSDTDVIFFKEEITLPRETVRLIPDGPAVPFGDTFAVAVATAQKEPIYDENIYNLFIQQSTSFDTIYDSVFVRPRLSGDRILKNGMHKKLKKLMCERNVPLRYRDTLPLFCDGKGILWVPTVELRDNAKGKDITLYVFQKKL